MCDRKRRPFGDQVGPANPPARSLLWLFVFLSLVASSDYAAAQSGFPRGLVRIVIGAGPGTPPDTVARTLADELSRSWGTPVITENILGLGGNSAGARVAEAEPDGHTLLLAASSGIVMNPSLYRNMPYNPIVDLRPITQVYSHPNVLVVHKDVPATTVQELVALARARPGTLTFASAGIGSSQHIAAEMMKAITGIDIVHVPYRGGVNLTTDLIAGRVDMSFGIPTSIVPQTREGHIRALAVSSAERFPSMPDLPTMAEAGLDYDMTVWWGLMAPSRTPSVIIERIHQDIKRILASREMQNRFDDLNIQPIGSSPTEFARVIEGEIPKWKKVISEAGITID